MKTTKSITARRSTKSTATKKSKRAAAKVRRITANSVVNFETGEIRESIFDAETGKPLTPEAARIDAEANAIFPPLKFVVILGDGTRRAGEMMDPRAEIYRIRAQIGHQVLNGNGQRFADGLATVVLVDRPDDFNPTGANAIPPFVSQRFVQPSAELAHEFAEAFNQAELKPESEGGNKRVWAVAVDRIPSELPSDSAAAITKKGAK